MSFSSLNAEVLELRRALQVYVGRNALEEISVRPPIGNDDEASFLRLTSWSYALLFEVGRVSIPFLLRLPSRKGIADRNLLRVRESVQSLRTFCFHNLGLTEHDARLSRIARDWHHEKCGTVFPKQSQEWRGCFEGLCSEVSQVIVHCHGVVDNVLASQTDGRGTIVELKRRLDRNWPGHSFDRLVEDILVRMDRKMNVTAFRNQHLSNWRKYLECIPEGIDIETEIIPLIERDVLNHFENMLPISGRDILSLGVPEGPLVHSYLQKARELHMMDGNLDKEELLDLLMKEFPSDNDRR